jgi:large subunit ribosomal protein L21
MRCPRLGQAVLLRKRLPPGPSSALLRSAAEGRGMRTRREQGMYAVIKTGGKQYRVSANDTLIIEKIAGDAGAMVEFGEVLMVGGNGTPVIGSPTVAGAKVTAEVVEQGRADKVIAFKKRRRKNSRRKRGHRQEQTTVRIKDIVGA